MASDERSNEEINEAIRERLRSLHVGRELTGLGLPVIALDSSGRIRRFGPDDYESESNEI